MIYPALPAKYDLGFARVAGAGLGNCFFTYFHAFVLAGQSGRRMIAPSWMSYRIGPLLRGERTLRHYGRSFRAHDDEISGPAKIHALAVGLPGARRIRMIPGQASSVGKERLSIFEAPDFTFAGLHDHRDAIRARLLEILKEPPSPLPDWGRGGYVAAHIRLGDFAVAAPGELESGQRANLRIPLSWYRDVIRLLQAEHPGKPVRLYSDGHARDLAMLLDLPGVELHAEPSDVEDLLALAQADLLIGSASTFSRWAAFLGDMESIWFDTVVHPEQPTGPTTPIAYLGATPQNLGEIADR